ncbi:MAG: DNA polymerase I [Desulfovibrio sp.]|nr:MAG: DNA polymerase I [Desulfovibrio sp.]
MTLASRLGFSQEPVFLVDGTAYLYRAFYAYQSMSRSDGLPTNAVYTLVRMFLKMIREENPKYLIYLLDGKGPTFRNELYEPYKAQREATPEPLIAQIEPVKEIIAKLGFPVQVSENCEADDLIAGLAKTFSADRPVVIVGTDKDLKQCLSDNVAMWDPMSKDNKVTTLADFREATQLVPDQWPDYQAVIGDSSDNIPGAPGVGPKTADKIFAIHPNLEAIRDGLDDLTPALRKKIEPHIHDLFVYRDLTRLRTDMCGSSSLTDLERQKADPQAVAAFFQEYEFRSLLRELKSDPSILGQGEPAASAGDQLSLFGPSQDQATAVETKTIDAQSIPDCTGKGVALVVTDKGLVLGLAAESGPGDEFFLDTTGNNHKALANALSSAATVYSPAFKDLLSHDLAWFDVNQEKWFDLGLAAYLLSPEDRGYHWEALTARFGPELSAGQDNPGLMALAMGEYLAERLQGAELAKLMAELETPLIPVLARMESQGMALDSEAVAAFLREVQHDLDRLTTRIHEVAGGPFNLRSSQQLAELLFSTLGLEPAGKTPGGLPSTSSTVLEKLRAKHPVIEDILEFRKLEKMRSTYLEPLPKLVGEDGRLRTTFNQLATATGRLSSSNPNLQNIPIRGDMGKRMRACFIAGPGNLLVAADYSQIELRVLAHMSQDPTLIQAFIDNVDIHRRTAGLLYDKEPDQIADEERRNAKTVNFGLIYGMGPQKLAQELKVTLKEAKEFIERYFSRLQALKEFYENVEAQAKEQGHVTTLAGRRRLLPDINSRNNQLQSLARRQAINTLIQGSAADIIKMAMLRVDGDAALRKLDARLILQVHDELLLELPGDVDQANAAADRLETLMSGVVELAVPLVVDKGVGVNWAEAH